ELRPAPRAGGVFAGTPPHRFPRGGRDSPFSSGGRNAPRFGLANLYARHLGHAAARDGAALSRRAAARLASHASGAGDFPLSLRPVLASPGVSRAVAGGAGRRSAQTGVRLLPVAPRRARRLRLCPGERGSGGPAESVPPLSRAERDGDERRSAGTSHTPIANSFHFSGW